MHQTSLKKNIKKYFIKKFYIKNYKRNINIKIIIREKKNTKIMLPLKSVKSSNFI